MSDPLPIDAGRARSPSTTPARRTRRPVHVVVAIGVTTGVYAGSLAWVTAQQADADRALIDDRAPVGEAIELLRDHHLQLSDSLDAARERYREATDRFSALSELASGLDGDIRDLAGAISRVERLAGRPSTFRLPPVGTTITVPRQPRSVARGAPPAVTTTTRASGK